MMELWIDIGIVLVVALATFTFFLDVMVERNHFNFTTSAVSTTLVTFFFGAVTLALGLFFADRLGTMLAHPPLWALQALIILFSGIIILYVVLPHTFKRPTKLINRYKDHVFLALDHRYILPKSIDIAFQQLVVVLLSLLLHELFGSLIVIGALFATLFGALHIPLFFLYGRYWGLFYTGASVLSGLLFPLLVLTIHYGFVITYIIHWTFYVVAGVSVWLWCASKKGSCT